MDQQGEVRGGLTPDDRALPLGQFRRAQLAVLLQALAMIAAVALSFPSFLDYRLHPRTCKPDQWCLDLRGLQFELGVVFLGLPVVLLLATYLLWRRPRRWPAVLPLLVDGAVIASAFAALVEFGWTAFAQPDGVVQVLLILVPAIVTLILVLALLRSSWSSASQDRT